MTITAYFDGCCEPVNPGGIASYGAVVFIDNQRVWETSQIFYPLKGKEKETSNNVAEYGGFISILKYLSDQGHQETPAVVYGDSRLVLYQMFGDPENKYRKWRIKKGFYVPLAHEAKGLLLPFQNMQGEWIPREQNGIADELSKAELLKAGVEFRIQPE